MQKIESLIKAGVDRVVEMGLTPGFVVLSLENYQKYLVELAAASKRDHLEAVDRYGAAQIVAIPGENVVEVVPQVLEMWEESEQFAPSSPLPFHGNASIKEQVSFAEL
jgi:hypothetical protein